MNEEEEKPESITDAEIEAFDQTAKEQFERSLRISQALREAQKPEAKEPQPGSDEAKEAIRDAIKQGNE